MLDDDARYQCQVSTGILGEPAIRSRFATLTVLVPPDPPRIVQGDTLYTTEDREIELECISANGKPPAEVRLCDSCKNWFSNVCWNEGISREWRSPHCLIANLCLNSLFQKSFTEPNYDFVISKAFIFPSNF